MLHLKLKDGLFRKAWFTFVLLLFIVAPLSAQTLSEFKVNLEDSLDLEQCIAVALENSYYIIQARDNVTLSEMDLKDSKAEFLPKLSLSGGYQVSDQNDQVAWNDDHYSMTLSGSITAFNGGKNILNIKRSKASLNSTRQSYILSEVSLILEVITRYYNSLEAIDIVELRNESMVQKRRDLEFATTQFELGLAPQADIVKAEVEMINAEIDSVQAAGDLLIARAELNNTMGINLDYPLRIESVELVLEPPPELDSCLTLAREIRPEVIQEKASLSIKKYDLRLSQINRWPSLSLTGSYNVYADQFAFNGVEITGDNWEDNSNWQVELGLSFPVFYGGAKPRAIKAARINLSNAELDFLDLQKEINLEVKTAHLNLLTAYKKVELTEKQVASAEINYNTAQGRYQTEVAPITEVIDAGVTLTQSKLNYTRAIYDYLLARSNLKKAMGETPY